MSDNCENCRRAGSILDEWRRVTDALREAVDQLNPDDLAQMERIEEMQERCRGLRAQAQEWIGVQS